MLQRRGIWLGQIKRCVTVTGKQEEDRKQKDAARPKNPGSQMEMIMT